MKPHWQDKASCRGEPLEKFIEPDVERGQRQRFMLPSQEVVAMCERCPVMGECLSWALRHEEHGIWGGLTHEQRMFISKSRHRVKCPICEGVTIVRAAQYDVCMSCGISWRAPERPAQSDEPDSISPAISTHSPQSSTQKPPPGHAVNTLLAERLMRQAPSGALPNP